MKDRIAKFIRVVTVPPVLVAAMLLIFRFVYRDKFISVPLLIIELVLLVVVPAAAYPVSGRKKGDGKDLRERQRKLAFIMNLFGYTFALVMGIIMKCSPMLRVILWGYFWSIIVLTIFNKVCKVRASGHACSCTMPYLLFGYFLGLRAVPVCLPYC